MRRQWLHLSRCFSRMRQTSHTLPDASWVGGLPLSLKLNNPRQHQVSLQQTANNLHLILISKTSHLTITSILISDRSQRNTVNQRSVSSILVTRNRRMICLHLEYQDSGLMQSLRSLHVSGSFTSTDNGLPFTVWWINRGHAC